MYKEIKAVYERLIGEKGSFHNVIISYFTNPNFQIALAIEKIRKCKGKKRGRFLALNLQRKHGIVVSADAIIGDNIRFPHPLGIVIGKGVVIGNNCTVYQNVTLGQNKGKFPKIGNNVIIYSNSTIVGDITIGDNVVIGANSVVIKSIDSNKVVGGNPARVLRDIVKGEDYEN